MLNINNYDIVADLYDTYVPVNFDVDFFVSETRKTEGDVLELMSGTGRVSIPLLEAGVHLTCVDLSEKSNVILRHKLSEKGLKAEVYDMDVCQLSLPKQFSMIIIPFHSFAHIISGVDQQKTLEHISQHLLPDGTFICTLRNPPVRRNDIDGLLNLVSSYPLDENGGKLLFWMLEQFSQDDNQVVNGFTLFEEYNAEGRLTTKRLLELHFRLTPKEEFENLLSRVGFKIKAVYGDYEYHGYDEKNSPSIVWVLEKA